MPQGIHNNNGTTGDQLDRGHSPLTENDANAHFQAPSKVAI